MTLALRALRAVFVTGVFVFLLLPILAVAVSSFSSSSPLSFPPQGFTLHWYRAISDEYFEALRVSLLVALSTTAIATLVGVPAALALVRGRFPGRAFFNAFCLSPLMVPTLIIAVAAFQFTIVLWDAFGLSVAGTVTGLVLAQSAFTIPFVVRAVIAGHAHFDGALEEAARNLGASPLETFFRVTLPLLLPGIVSGAIFAFVMSFDDIAVALFVGGGDAMTLPVKIYTSVEFNFDADIMAVSTLVTAGSLALMLVLDRLIGIDRFSNAAGG
jgi:putative spermidine/putrescine transport system permease protein